MSLPELSQTLSAAIGPCRRTTPVVGSRSVSAANAAESPVREGDTVRVPAEAESVSV